MNPNLVGSTLHNFDVTTVLRYQPNGERVYGCRCLDCGAYDVPVPHHKLNNGTARCIASGHTKSAATNGGTLAHTRHIPTGIRSVDADEFREYMRPIREQEQAQAAAIQREREEQDRMKAERQAADQRYHEQVTSQWREYANHAMFIWRRSVAEITPLETWAKIRDEDRQRVMNRIAAEQRGATV